MTEGSVGVSKLSASLEGTGMEGMSGRREDLRDLADSRNERSWGVTGTETVKSEPKNRTVYCTPTSGSGLQGT